MNSSEMYNSVPVTPSGLQAIYNACRSIYPDQPNPLQVTALVKYWLGGPDPLDYVSMYSNPGNEARGIPPHWHYVSFGLTDLHGDGRVHERRSSEDPSGFGFELTFRLRRDEDQTSPPTWPAALLQGLARYVFNSENSLCVGDHVSWHNPLDNSESQIQHMLMSEDSQLPTLHTVHGSVQFIQVVGVCAEELRAAQHWNGPGLLELLRHSQPAGGAWLVTDMRRGESIFDLDPSLQERLEQGIEQEGSNLSGVSARCQWSATYTDSETDIRPGDVRGDDVLSATDDDKENRHFDSDRYMSYSSDSDREGRFRKRLSDKQSDQIKAVLRRGLKYNVPNLPTHEETSKSDRFLYRSVDSGGSMRSDNISELLRARKASCVHLRLNLEAGCLLSLALRGRLRHGRHFTFKSALCESAFTFVSSSVDGAIVSEDRPYASHGPWLQLFLTDEFVDTILEDVDDVTRLKEELLPKTFDWPNRGLKITIVSDTLA